MDDFQIALEKFKRDAKLSEGEVRDMEATSLGQLRTTIAQIQTEQGKSRTLLYMRRLKPFLKSMEYYAKCIEVFVEASDILALVWVASSMQEALTALLDAYQDIGEQMPQLQAYQDYSKVNPYLKEILGMLYGDILEFHREALKCFKKKVWKQLFQATWRGLQTRIQHIKDNIAQHRRLIDSQMTLMEFEHVVKTHTLAEAEFKAAREAEMGRRRRIVHEWLDPYNSELVHDEHSSARAGDPQCGTWLIEDTTFQKWFHPNLCSKPLLWLNGIPGAGKSVLASRIVDEIRRLPNSSLAFFYCKYGDITRNTFLSVAKGTVAQLLAQNQGLLPYLYEKLSTGGEATLKSPRLAEELLETALTAQSRVYIVIDGLDECDRNERKHISQWFCNIVNKQSKKNSDSIRCLFVSQEDNTAKKDLSKITSIKISQRDNRGDIERYVRAQERIIKVGFASHQLDQYNITDLIVARSQGMFLYAKLVAEDLAEQPSVESLIEQLRPGNLPTGLDEAYGRIVDRLKNPGIPENRRLQTFKLLGWLACAKRPLRWYEIQGAMSLDLDEQTVKETRRLAKDPKELCSSLVEQHSDGTIALVHSTTRGYLIKVKEIAEIQVERELALLAVSYLNFDEIQPDLQQDKIHQAILRGAYAFYDYAVVCWVLHLLEALQKGDPDVWTAEVSETLEAFLQLHWSLDSAECSVSKAWPAHQKLRALNPIDEYDKLSKAVWCSQKRIRIQSDGAPVEDVLDLSRITCQIRAVLEQFGTPQTSRDERELVVKFHGQALFKCPRVSCQHFFDGFSTLAARNKHVERHERPYLCIIEGCTMGTFGCSTAKALEAHMWETHGIDTSSTDEFPEPLRRSAPQASQEGAFRCEICSKAFGRKFNLKIHQKVHSDEKPWRCSTCDKKFAREHDLKRHQDSHVGQKTFVCRGLRNGKVWGCDKAFTRSEHLQKHLQSKKGMQCLRRLRVEGETEAEAWQGDQGDLEDARNFLPSKEQRNKGQEGFGQGVSETGDEWWEEFVRDAERGGEEWWQELTKMMMAR
ncbi:hypothetical protein GQ53DRAFT_646497 [Thozetella sp. PMI_491]|nr:hypothetical protein GQ53DRAFT_646497 [Thozetella sp. PMI_491]